MLHGLQRAESLITPQEESRADILVILVACEQYFISWLFFCAGGACCCL
jgi:hypothetical protein